MTIVAVLKSGQKARIPCIQLQKSWNQGCDRYGFTRAPNPCDVLRVPRRHCSWPFQWRRRLNFGHAGMFGNYWNWAYMLIGRSLQFQQFTWQNQALNGCICEFRFTQSTRLQIRNTVTGSRRSYCCCTGRARESPEIGTRRMAVGCFGVAIYLLT